MPIRPEHKRLYPFDWPQLSHAVRFRRAGGRCEQCGRPHATLIPQLSDGTWWDAERHMWRSDQGRKRRLPSPDVLAAAMPPLMPELPAPLPYALRRSILAAAHRNHDPTDNSPRNLLALCGRCHLAHDRPEHQRRRFVTLRQRRAMRDLFGSA